MSTFYNSSSVKPNSEKLYNSRLLFVCESQKKYIAPNSVSSLKNKRKKCQLLIFLTYTHTHVYMYINYSATTKTK